MQLPLPGERFERKYEIQQVLGRGGFAIVYRATDLEVGRDVAIKVLMPREEGYPPDLVSRFLREARVIAGLRDPHTITMFDFGTSESGVLYMVFEFVSGRDLSVLVGEVGPLSEEATVHIIVQVLQALREAHAAGVLHRDIKPANVLVYDYMGDSLSVKLLDFGIAKPTASTGASPIATLTAAGSMVGTPRYMSPEQIYGEETTPASDLYSLGLVGIELLTGRPAIGGTNTKETLQAQLSDRPLRLPPTLGLSLHVRGVIERMAAREPHDRFQSATEALEALGFAPRTTPQVRATPQPQPTPDFATRPAPHGTPLPPSAHTTGRSLAAKPPTLDENNQSAVIEKTDLLSLVGVAVVGVIVTVVVLVGLMTLTRDKEPDRRRQLPPAGVTERPPPREPVGKAQERVAPEPDAGEETSLTILDTDAGQAPVAVVTGCGRDAPFRGDRRFATRLHGRDRFWTAYVPESYEPAVQYPVIVMFHDHTRSGLQMLHDTQMREVADEHGVVLIAPDAVDTQAPWQERGAIDIVQTSIDEMSKALCLDHRRIFALGHNTGAQMVEEFACQFRFSAIATTAYRERRDVRSCAADPPVPHIHLEGVHNKYYPIQGGMGCKGADVIPLDEKEDLWWNRNGCEGPPTKFHEEKSGTCHAKKCRDAAFVSCRLDGGRDWPNSAPRSFELDWCKVRAPDFAIAKVIWKFFREHGKDRLAP